MPILHCNTSHLNVLTIGTYRDFCGTVSLFTFYWNFFEQERPYYKSRFQFVTKYPLEKILFGPTSGCRGSKLFEDNLHLFKENVIGPSLDRVGMMMGRKPLWVHDGDIIFSKWKPIRFPACYEFGILLVLSRKSCVDYSELKLAKMSCSLFSSGFVVGFIRRGSA